jgi:hypothetical protein
MDLSAFHAEIEAVEAGPGRPAIDPRILLVLWLYATSEGVGSARHLARLCKEHDAFRWISGGLEICHRVLSDFRVHHGKKLDGLLSELLDEGGRPDAAHRGAGWNQGQGERGGSLVPPREEPEEVPARGQAAGFDAEGPTG